MRTLLIVTIALLASSVSFAQMGGRFEDAEKTGVTIKHLDSTYKSAMHVDKKLAAFAGKEDQVQKNYIKMLQSLGMFLDSKKFKWDKTTHCFNRIYFREDGHIDYFLYNFRGEITAEKEAEFKQLLNEFIKTYQFPMHNKVKFAQCSPVTYQDA